MPSPGASAQRRAFARRLGAGLLALLLVAGTPARAGPPPAPQRIVSLAPHITALLFEAGLGDRVVGVTDACDAPPAARRLPRVANHRGASIEAILALKPDLVLAWPSGNQAADLEALRRLGVRVEASEPRTFSHILAELRRFATWASPEALARAEARAAALSGRIERLRREAGRRSQLRIFYQLGAERLFTLSNQHLVGEALTLCGAENVFGWASHPAPEVSREAVLAAHPEAIVVANPEALAAVRSAWRRAGLNPQTPVVAIDGTHLHRPTLASFDALEALCTALDRLRQTQRTEAR